MKWREDGGLNALAAIAEAQRNKLA